MTERKNLSGIVIPGNCPVVIVVDPHIEQDVQYESKIEKGKVESVHLFTHTVLHSHLNTKEPEWFNKEIKKDQQGKVGDESLFQNRLYKIFFNSTQM
jgi:hypothetical protein